MLLIYTLNGIFLFLQLSMTNFVPRDFPSQNAKTASAYSIIVMFLFSGADLPYFSYSGKNSVNLSPFSLAYFLAEVSMPLAPIEQLIKKRIAEFEATHGEIDLNC